MIRKLGMITKLKPEQKDIFTDDFLKALEIIYGEPRDDSYVHASDLTLCGTRVLLRKKFPNVEKVDQRQASIFARGELLHDKAKLTLFRKLLDTLTEDDISLAQEKIVREYLSSPQKLKHLQEVLVNYFSDGKLTFEKEWEAFDRRLRGHIDIYYEKENIPVELKTTVPATFKLNDWDKDFPKIHHIFQLQMYMAFTEAEKGLLVYYAVSDYNDPFKRYEVIMSSRERQILRDDIEKLVNQYEYAQKTDKPHLAPKHLENDDNTWYCQYCPFRELGNCEEGRIAYSAYMTRQAEKKAKEKAEKEAIKKLAKTK